MYLEYLLMHKFAKIRI